MNGCPVQRCCIGELLSLELSDNGRVGFSWQKSYESLNYLGFFRVDVLY
jgi:hypothetical protein